MGRREKKKAGSHTRRMKKSASGRKTTRATTGTTRGSRFSSFAFFFFCLLSVSLFFVGVHFNCSTITSTTTMKVCVTGANGQTGSIVVRKLLERKSKGENLDVVAVVRSEASKQQLLKQLPDVAEEAMVKVDAFQKESLSETFKGCDKLVVLTSSKPKLQFSSLPGVLWQKFVMRKEGVKPTFYFPEGQEPKMVDYVGQRDQIDAAKQVGVKHVVLISSMAGTKPDHFLNTMGGGGIVLWKRKAEVHLIESGLDYTVIHPGGLLPHHGKKEPAEGGKRELLVSVDDKLLESETRVIPREDLAEVIVQSLTTKEAVNTSWDLTSKGEGEGEIFTTLSKLLKSASTLHCNFDTPELPTM